MKILKSLGWGLMLFFAVGISLVSARYFSGDASVYFEQQKFVYIAHTFGIVSHIAGSIIALLLGPFQFLPRLRRKKWLTVHRWIGRLYLVGILVGGLAGFYMATLSYGGIITHLGFAGLAAAWLYTGGMAYWTIRQRNIKAHQAWMIRNYALTFAAVTLRLQLPIFGTLFGFTTGYQIVSWTAWIPNLIIAQIIIMRTVYKTHQSHLEPQAA